MGRRSRREQPRRGAGAPGHPTCGASRGSASGLRAARTRAVLRRQALLANGDLADVVQNMEMLERRRYGLAMAIASGDWESVRTVLKPLMRAPRPRHRPPARSRLRRPGAQGATASRAVRQRACGCRRRGGCQTAVPDLHEAGGTQGDGSRYELPVQRVGPALQPDVGVGRGEPTGSQPQMHRSSSQVIRVTEMESRNWR